MAELPSDDVNSIAWSVIVMVELLHNEPMQEADMTLSAQQIIDSFEELPELEKQRVAYEILRRSVQLEVPPLADEELIVAAEGLFLTLDAREAKSDSSESGRGLVS